MQAAMPATGRASTKTAKTTPFIGAVSQLAMAKTIRTTSTTTAKVLFVFRMESYNRKLCLDEEGKVAYPG